MDTDDALIAGLAHDLDGTFEGLVLAHQDRCYSIALRMLGDPGAAEEAAQDALVRAYRAMAGYDATRILELRLRPWLATIVLNLCRTRLARRAGKGRTPLSLDADPDRVSLPEPAATDPSTSPTVVAERRAAREHWAGLLATLPPAYRAAVVLATRRRPVLSRSRRGPRATRGDRQGPGPPWPGDVAYRTRDGESPRARGDDRMTTDDLTLETAMADLATTAPDAPRPECPRRGRPRRPDGPHRLRDRPALRRVERPGREWCRVRRVRGEPRGPHRSPGLPGRDDPRRPGTGDRAAAGRRPPGPHRPRPPRPQRVRTRRVARRPSRSRAARSGRTAGSPPRSVDRRRSAPSGRRSATTRSRSSSRAIGSSGPTAIIGQYSLGGPENKRTILASEGLDPDEMEEAARRGERLVGCATTNIVCLPTCRTRRHMLARNRRPFRSLEDAAAAGYRPCKVCRPVSGAGAVAA